MLHVTQIVSTGNIRAYRNQSLPILPGDDLRGSLQFHVGNILEVDCRTIAVSHYQVFYVHFVLSALLRQTDTYVVLVTAFTVLGVSVTLNGDAHCSGDLSHANSSVCCSQPVNRHLEFGFSNLPGVLNIYNPFGFLHNFLNCSSLCLHFIHVRAGYLHCNVTNSAHSGSDNDANYCAGNAGNFLSDFFRNSLNSAFSFGQTHEFYGSTPILRPSITGTKSP